MFKFLMALIVTGVADLIISVGQVYWKLTLLNQLMISRGLSVQQFLPDLRHDLYRCKRLIGLNIGFLIQIAASALLLVVVSLF